MFLLILYNVNTGEYVEFNFTLHYVSINTKLRGLSSTFDSVFTFHYVSINTSKRKCRRIWITFTFHYVSINTN